MLNKKFQVLALLGSVIFLWAAGLQAQEDEVDAPADANLFGDGSSNTSGKQGKTGVLDFEGETIEGQRKRPDLFLQTETQNLTLDAILYLRKDFNDFHQVDKSRRPGYIERKTRKRP